MWLNPADSADMGTAQFSQTILNLVTIIVRVLTIITIMQMYFIAIVLPDELNKKVLRWKHFMHERFGCEVGLKSPAHITLVQPFWMQQEKEHQLIADMDAISSLASPFTIDTRNFSTFKPRTIYIDVAVNEELNH